MPRNLSRRQFLGGVSVMLASQVSGRFFDGALASTPVSAVPKLLFDVSFLRDWQPADEAQGAFYRIVLQPGDEISYLPGPYCGCSGERIQEGTAAEVVMSGTYSIALDKAFIVRKQGIDDEAIDPGSSATLEAGDVAIYPDAIASGSLRNTGEDQITLYGASITGLRREEGTLTPDLPEGMSARLSSAVWTIWQTLGDGAIDARLTSSTLPAGQTLPPYEVVGLESVHVPAGQIASQTLPPGVSTPVGDPLLIREGGTIAFRELTPGTQRLLDNPSVQDAELLTLDFTGQR